MTFVVTGGACFIGTNFVLDWLAQSDESIITLDRLTYAGKLEDLASLHNDARVCCKKLVLAKSLGGLLAG